MIELRLRIVNDTERALMSEKLFLCIASADPPPGIPGVHFSDWSKPYSAVLEWRWIVLGETAMGDVKSDWQRVPIETPR